MFQFPTLHLSFHLITLNLLQFLANLLLNLICSFSSFEVLEKQNASHFLFWVYNRIFNKISHFLTKRMALNSVKEEISFYNFEGEIKKRIEFLLNQ